MRYAEDGTGIYVGHRVRIERNEDQYPPRGTWAQYRGREGVVVQLNRTDQEVGVSFEANARPGVGGYSLASWFKPWELRRLD